MINHDFAFPTYVLIVIKAFEDWEALHVVKPEKKVKLKVKEEKKKQPPRKVRFTSNIYELQAIYKLGSRCPGLLVVNKKARPLKFAAFEHKVGPGSKKWEEFLKRTDLSKTPVTQVPGVASTLGCELKKM